MIDRVQEQMQKQSAGAMFERFRPQMEALATVVARREASQLRLAQRLAEASDAEVSVDAVADVEERADQLEAMAEAAATQDLEGWYFGEFAPDHLDNPEQAAQYAGLDGDAWENQIAAWATAYRSQSPEAESFEDRELAGIHVENEFGVPLEEFEQNVVDWSPGEGIETVLTAHLTTVEQVMATVAADLEGEE
ncbi:hypothetical protein [Halobacterium wangiae]|uniref:hypothetical protein n=1 Tax=Halobacterium wangiae TaxID=2902623 RepID=UPI001E5285FF|nr:hypothetical protein [Halobacterium wangiae]